MSADNNLPDVLGGNEIPPVEDVDRYGMLFDEHPEELPATPSEPVEEPAEPAAAPPEPVEVHDGVSAWGGGSAVGPISGSNTDAAGRDIDKSQNSQNHYYGTIIYSMGGREQTPEVARSADPGTRRREWDAEALRKLAEKYVVPSGLLEPVRPHERSVYRTLMSRRVVALVAPVDRGGHEAAALRLAHEIRSGAARDLVVCGELVDRDFRLEAKALLYEGRPTVVILDLRDALDDAVLRVRNKLVSFTEELESRDSHLVILLPRGQWENFDEQFPDRVHELGRPSASKVLVRHLRGVDDPAALLEQPRLAAQLEEAWPPRAAKLARWISDAVEVGHEDPADRACGAAEDWSEKLREDIRKHQQDDVNAEWLSLLLAAALLEGASPQQIVAASDRLLRRLGHEPSEAESLLRPGVVTTLKTIEKDSSYDVRQGRFELPRYGASVLRHFWSEHPMLQGPLRDWMGALRVGGLQRRDLERVADRTTELARVTGPRVAIDLAKEWARPENGNAALTSDSRFDRSRRSIAVRLLTNTALDPGTGRHVRDQLYNWAQQRATPADLGMVVAEVCGGEMSVEFPRVALTRLKHLAASENEMVHGAVVNALGRIGEYLGLSVFLRHVEEWFDRPEPARLATLAEGIEAVLVSAFEGGAPPVDSLGGTAVRSFWRRALDVMPLEESRRVVAAWLKPVEHLDDADHRDRMVEALVAATERQPHRIQRLYYASRIATLPSESTSDADPDSLGDVVQQVWTRLDEVDPLRT